MNTPRRALAQPLGRWDDLRPELHRLVQEKGQGDLLIQLAVDDGEIDRALELLRTLPPPPVWLGAGYRVYGGGIALHVADAAAATRLAAARDTCRAHAERLIEARGRENYRAAAALLAKVRDLSIALGEEDWWARYIAALRDKNRALRALKGDLRTAGL